MEAVMRYTETMINANAFYFVAFNPVLLRYQICYKSVHAFFKYNHIIKLH